MKKQKRHHHSHHHNGGPDRAYPPGHFLALVYAHNWPPAFTPEIGSRKEDLTLTNRRKGMEKARQLAEESGKGWGKGTMIPERATTRPVPGMLVRRKDEVEVLPDHAPIEQFPRRRAQKR